MNTENIIQIINSLVNQDNYSRARMYIVKHLDKILEPKHYRNLNTEAKSFITIIQEKQSLEKDSNLTNSEKEIIEKINRYVHNAQFLWSNRMFVKHKKLLEKPESQQWLTQEARTLYDAWIKTAS